MTGRMQNGLLLFSRLLLAAALLPTGIARALNVSGFALTLAAAGLPSPNALATAAVIIQVFGPLAIIVGVMPRFSGFALASFATLMALPLHGFWHFTGASAVVERTLFLADLGLAGGFLMYALTGPGAWSWYGWRRERQEGGPRAQARAAAPKTASAKTGPAKPASAKSGARGNRPSGRAPTRAAA